MDKKPIIAILLTDKYSNTKGRLYGKKGDVVTIVTKDHVPVIIVEDSKGTRFSVNENNIKEQ